MFACLFSPNPAAASALVRVGRDFSPRVECPSRAHTDTVVLIDLEGLERLFGEPHELAAELLAAVCRLPADAADTIHVTSVGLAIAGTRAAAEIIARTSPGPAVIAKGAEAAALAPLAVSTLAPLGASADLLATLERWGIRTLGEFAVLPRARLASRIGQDGLLWQRRSRGEDDRPLVPTPLEERFEDTIDLEWPIDGVEPLAFVLGRLLDPLCERLERRDRAVAALELRLRLTVPRVWQMRRLELPAPMRDARMLRTLLCLDLESRPPADHDDQPGSPGSPGSLGSIDRVGLFLEPTPARVCQFSLLARPTVSLEQATTLMARLRALMGQDRCGAPRRVDSHRPGAFALAPDWTGESGQSGRLAPDPPAPPDRPDLPTPVLPLRALRRLRHPIPARVALEHQRPVRVTTDRRGWSGGRVVWCSGPWRSSGDWWHLAARVESESAVHGAGQAGKAGKSGEKEHSDHTEARRISTRPASDLPTLPGLPAATSRPQLFEGATQGGPWDHAEWDVALSDGSACILHEDRQRGGWFVDAVID
jgi:protein ImuB